MAEFVNPHDITVIEKNTEPEKMLYYSGSLADSDAVDLIPNRRRRSPIILEFSDSRVSVVDIIRAMQGGMNIIKFRMAFTTHEEKLKLLAKVDQAGTFCAEKMGDNYWPTATCIACKTFIIKMGILKRVSADEITLYKGKTVLLTYDIAYMDMCTEDKIFIDYANLSTDIKVGMEISIGFGKILARCIDIVDHHTIRVKITKTGTLKSLETVNVRNMKRSIPFIGLADIKIIKFALRYEMDIMIIYYAETAQHMQSVKKIMSNSKIRPRLFAGLCTLESINNIDDILREADGILFAREFLQFELDEARASQLAKIQKFVVGKCIQAGVPAFISGILDDAFESEKLSQSNIFDVSNALLDGFTGFLLREVSQTQNLRVIMEELNDICCNIEPLTFNENAFWRMLEEPKMPVNAAEAAVIACIAVANQLRSRVIVISSVTGSTARALLWLRPACIVITVGTRTHIARSLYTCRNVVPLMTSVQYNQDEKKMGHTEEERVIQGAYYAVARQWLRNGDMYVSLQKSSDARIYCDMLMIRVVDFYKKVLIECDYPEYDKRKSSEGSAGARTSKEIKDINEKDLKTESTPFVPGLQ